MYNNVHIMIVIKKMYIIKRTNESFLPVLILKVTNFSH